MAELLVWPALIAYGEAAVAYAGVLRGRWVDSTRLAIWGVRIGWLAQTALLIAQALERRERRQAQAQDVRGAPLQPRLLPEVEPGETRSEREAGERSEHETDMQHEEEIAVVGALTGAGAAADPRDDEESRRQRHHRQTEQPEARAAAPDQVGADDEPDEEVERAGPRRPREAVGASGLHDEQRRLREPADPNTPRRRA